MSDLRTPLARVRGLGSAHDGVHHWWVQRVSALALIPLSLWFVISLMTQLGNADRVGVADWFESPFHALLTLTFLLTGLFHMRLGMQVIVEDYVHKKCMKTALLLLNTYGSLALMALAFISICKLHFVGI